MKYVSRKEKESRYRGGREGELLIFIFYLLFRHRIYICIYFKKVRGAGDVKELAFVSLLCKFFIINLFRRLYLSLLRTIGIGTRGCLPIQKGYNFKNFFVKENLFFHIKPKKKTPDQVNSCESGLLISLIYVRNKWLIQE